MQESLYESGNCVQIICAIQGVHPNGFGPKIDPNEHGSYAFLCVLWLSPSYPYSVFSDALSSSLLMFSGCEKQIVSRPVDRQGTVGQTIQMRRNARLSSVS